MATEFAEYYGSEVEVIESRVICALPHYEIVHIRRTDGKPFVYEVGGPNDGPSYVTESMTLWVASDYIKNRRTEEIPDNLPIPADPSIDAPVDVTDEMDADRTRAHLQSVYYGEA